MIATMSRGIRGLVHHEVMKLRILLGLESSFLRVFVVRQNRQNYEFFTKRWAAVCHNPNV